MKTMMNNIYKIGLAISLVLAITSCNKDSEVANEGYGNEAIKFGSNITPMLRATDTDWETNDEIGVFAMQNGTNLSTATHRNKRYFTSNTNGIFFPKESSEAIKFDKQHDLDVIAYYPYNASVDNIYPIDVKDQKQLQKIDLLYSNELKGINSNTPKKDVKLHFRHQLAKVHFDIKGLTKGLKFSLKDFETEADFDLATGQISNRRNKADIEGHTSGTVCEAIIIPEGESKDFVFEANGFTYKFKATQTFESGKLYRYTLNLKGDGSMEILNPDATIDDWNDINGGDIDLNEGEGDPMPDKNVADITINDNDLAIVIDNTKAAQKTIHLETTGHWTINSSAEWVKTDVKQGTGSTNLTINIDENTGDKRTATLTITSVNELRATNKQHTITITQEGVAKTPDKERIELFNEGFSKLKAGNSYNKTKPFSEIYKEYVDNSDIEFSLTPDVKKAIRTSKNLDGHIWFTIGNEYTLEIKDIPTKGIKSDLSVKYRIGFQSPKNSNKEDIKVFIKDGNETKELHPKGPEFVKGNEMYPFEASAGDIKSDKISLIFKVSVMYKSNAGYRLNNIIIDGIK